jgi:serine/threonine protein kinase
MSQSPSSRALGKKGRVDPPAARGRKPARKAVVEEYNVTQTISRSTEGLVHEAIQASTNRRVAIKLLPRGEKKATELFRCDVVTLKALAHPNVTPVFDSGEMPDGQRYIVMDFIDGTSLADKLEDGKPTPADAVRILGELCAGVEAMHAVGLLHRCIKPSGILISKDGRARVAGFASDPQSVEARDYAAPEQLVGLGVDARSDIYSLGIVGYEMLTGRTPQGAWTPPSLTNTELDPGLDTVLLTAMQSAPSRRFQSVTEMRNALAKCGAAFLERGEREVASVVNVQRRTRLALAFGGIAVLAGVVAVSAWRKSEDASEARNIAEQRRNEAESDASLAIRRADRERATRGESERLLALFAEEVRGGAAGEGNRTDPAELLAQAGAYFDKIHTGDVDDATLVRRLAVMQARAKALDAAGKLDEAVALGREHLKLAGDLAAKLKDDRERQLAAVESFHFLAACLFKKGAREEALALAIEARTRMAALREKFEKKPSSEAVYVRTCRQLGSILAAQNDPDGAAAALGEALAIWQPIADDSPAHPHRQAEYSEILRQLGELAMMRRDDKTALEFVSRAIESDRRVYDPATWDATQRLRFATNLSTAAETHARLGEEEKSALLIQKTVPILEQLEARAPSLLPPALKHAVYGHAADLARVEGRLSEAVDYQRRANDAEKHLNPQRVATPDPGGVELIKPEYTSMPPPPPPIAEPPPLSEPAPLPAK